MIDFDNTAFLLPALVMMCWSIWTFLKKDVTSAQLLLTATMSLSAMAIVYRQYTALFIAPFYYLAIRRQTALEEISKWEYLMFLPAVICTPVAQGTIVFEIVLYLQMAGVTLWSLYASHRYMNTVAEYYDTSDDSPSETLRQIVIFSTIGMVISVLYVYLHSFVAESAPIVIITTILLTLLTFMIGRYVCALQMLTIKTENAEEEATTIPQSVKDDNGDDILHKELQKIEDEKMYLDPMLSLVSLAEKLSTNRTYLSESIHKCHNQNFSDYINTLRIHHALELMKAGGENVNIKDVALSSGYNHLQSFYRNFALIMQMTPKTWLAKHNR